MDAIRVLFGEREFQLGLFAGALALAAVLPVGARKGARPPGLAGVAFAVAGSWAIATGSRLPHDVAAPTDLYLGVALAGGAALLAARLPAPLVALAALPGAVVTSRALIDVDQWVQVVVALYGAVGGALAADFDGAHRRRGLGPVLLAVTVIGVYSTVPDTEFARALLGAALPLALLGLPRPFAGLGTGGAVASMCLVGWVIGQEGAARPGAVVGAIGTLGVLAVEPCTRRVAALGRPRRRQARSPAALHAHVLVVHAVIVAGAARWAGFAQDAGTAAWRLAAVGAFALLLTASIPPLRDERSDSGRTSRAQSARRSRRKRSSRSSGRSRDRAGNRNHRHHHHYRSK